MFIKATQRLFFGYSYKFLNRNRLFSIVTNHDDIKEETVNTKTLKVAIIGCPNVGKSTFINNIMDRKVFLSDCSSYYDYLIVFIITGLSNFIKSSYNKKKISSYIYRG